MRALVTGGTRGIGAAICDRLREAGHDVVTFSRATGVDALNPVSREIFKAKMSADFDILVNNVGGGGRWGPQESERAGPLVWQEVWQKNVAAASDFTSWVLPGMMEHGFGRVVTISSLHGLDFACRPWFAAAKAAQIAMMGAFAKDPRFVRSGITFNTVCPGNVRTDGKPVIDMSHSALGRMGTTAEIASVVGFLCSPEASLVNGAIVKVGEV